MVYRLHDLKRQITDKRSHNSLGRGNASGSGKTCGRGHKGAKSRSGYSRKLGYIGGGCKMHEVLPVARGAQKNPACRNKPKTLGLVVLNRLFKDRANVEVVDKKLLMEVGFNCPFGIKVVASDIDLAVDIKVIYAVGFSKKASEMLSTKGIQMKKGR